MLRTHEIQIYSAINQSYFIIHMFDLRQTLEKYLRTFFHKNAVMMIGLMDQSDYSIYQFMVIIFIRTTPFIYIYISTYVDNGTTKVPILAKIGTC